MKIFSAWPKYSKLYFSETLHFAEFKYVFRFFIYCFDKNSNQISWAIKTFYIWFQVTVQFLDVQNAKRNSLAKLVKGIIAVSIDQNGILEQTKITDEIWRKSTHAKLPQSEVPKRVKSDPDILFCLSFHMLIWYPWLLLTQCITCF